jgi:autotransporter-associated beta strand protein
LTKKGPGTLHLTGTNTYSGGTIVSAGTLVGDTNSLQGAIVNDAAVVFDQASSGTYAGAMSGSGSLTKQGSGIVTLTGGNSYGGGTLVNGGTLVVNNTTGSATGNGAVTVNSGMLAGNGLIAGAVNVNNGGTLAPGCSIDALDVGALTFNTGATFDVELDTNASLTAAADLVNANGNLGIFAGAILAIADLGNTLLTAGTKLTLLSYAGAWNGGTFDGYADDSLLTVSVNQYVLNYNDTSATPGENFGGGEYAHNVTLTAANTAAVPEASSFLFAAVVCIALTTAHFTRKLLKLHGLA